MVTGSDPSTRYSTAWKQRGIEVEEMAFLGSLIPIPCCFLQDGWSEEVQRDGQQSEARPALTHRRAADSALYMPWQYKASFLTLSHDSALHVGRAE